MVVPPTSPTNSEAARGRSSLKQASLLASNAPTRPQHLPAHEPRDEFTNQSVESVRKINEDHSRGKLQRIHHTPKGLQKLGSKRHLHSRKSSTLPLRSLPAQKVHKSRSDQRVHPLGNGRQEHNASVILCLQMRSSLVDHCHLSSLGGDWFMLPHANLEQ